MSGETLPPLRRPRRTSAPRLVGVVSVNRVIRHGITRVGRYCDRCGQHLQRCACKGRAAPD